MTASARGRYFWLPKILSLHEHWIMVVGMGGVNRYCRQASKGFGTYISSFELTGGIFHLSSSTSVVLHVSESFKLSGASKMHDEFVWAEEGLVSC